METIYLLPHSITRIYFLLNRHPIFPSRPLSKTYSVCFYCLYVRACQKHYRPSIYYHVSMLFNRYSCTFSVVFRSEPFPLRLRPLWYENEGILSRDTSGRREKADWDLVGNVESIRPSPVLRINNAICGTIFMFYLTTIN